MCKFKILLIAIFYSFASLAQVAPDELQLKLQQKINDTIGYYDPNVNLGLSLVRLSDGKVLLSMNENRYYTPASINKLFIAAAALATFQPDYKIKTQLFLEDVDGSSNQKNVYIKFLGSPELTVDDLSAMILQLKIERQDIIINKVFIDEGEYLMDPLSPGVQVEDLDFCYASPMSNIAINKNSNQLKLVPSKVEGGIAQIIDSNGKPVSNIKSKVITTKSCDTTCDLDKKNVDGNYILTGKIHKHSSPKDICLTIKDITKHAILAVENIFQANNVLYQGKVSLSKTPDNAKLFAEHLSRDMLNIIKSGLISSDNFLMNAVFLQLTLPNKPKDWFAAGEIIENIVYEKYNLSPKSLNLEDGSGIGRNFVTPKTFVTFLQNMYHSNYFNDFIKTLPRAAIDGTMLYRLLHVNNKVNVVAKTGSTSCVSSLAGYLQTGKETYAFVIIVNGNLKNKEYYREMVDKVVENISDLVAS